MVAIATRERGLVLKAKDDTCEGEMIVSIMKEESADLMCNS